MRGRAIHRATASRVIVFAFELLITNDALDKISKIPKITLQISEKAFQGVPKSKVLVKGTR